MARANTDSRRVASGHPTPGSFRKSVPTVPTKTCDTAKQAKRERATQVCLAANENGAVAGAVVVEKL